MIENIDISGSNYDVEESLQKYVQKRIGKPEIENVKLPLWEWKYYNGKSSPKPRRSIDLFGTGDEELVYMELLIPSNRLLASDFTIWNCAMGCLEAEIEV